MFYGITSLRLLVTKYVIEQNMPILTDIEKTGFPKGKGRGIN